MLHVDKSIVWPYGHMHARTPLSDLRRLHQIRVGPDLRQGEDDASSETRVTDLPFAPPWHIRSSSATAHAGRMCVFWVRLGEASLRATSSTTTNSLLGWQVRARGSSHGLRLRILDRIAGRQGRQRKPRSVAGVSRTPRNGRAQEDEPLPIDPWVSGENQQSGYNEKFVETTFGVN